MVSIDFAFDVAVDFRRRLREMLEGDSMGVLCVDHLEVVGV